MKILAMIASLGIAASVPQDEGMPNPVKDRYVLEVESEEVHTLKFFSPGAEGKERNTGTITCQRKKGIPGASPEGTS